LYRDYTQNRTKYKNESLNIKYMNNKIKANEMIIKNIFCSFTSFTI